MRETAKDILTVVVPVYNRAEIVLRTLDSIATQSVSPSLIIVDNGSTDNTLNSITEWAHLHKSEKFPIRIAVEMHPGASGARQLGLTMTKTPYVMFFDSDDLMLQDHIERFVKAIGQNPDTDIFGWDISVKEIDGSHTKYPFTDKDIAFRHIFNGIFSTQRYVAKTQFIKSIGGWNPTVLGWDDYELGVRIVCHAPKVKHLAGTPTVELYRLTNSITGTDYSSGASKWEHAISICRDTLERYGNPQWASWLELKSAVLAGLYGREGNRTDRTRLMEEILHRTPSAQKRLLLKLACSYTAYGGRGIHHVLRHLI